MPMSAIKRFASSHTQRRAASARAARLERSVWSVQSRPSMRLSATSVFKAFFFTRFDVVPYSISKVHIYFKKYFSIFLFHLFHLCMLSCSPEPKLATHQLPSITTR